MEGIKCYASFITYSASVENGWYFSQKFCAFQVVVTGDVRADKPYFNAIHSPNNITQSGCIFSALGLSDAIRAMAKARQAGGTLWATLFLCR